jgi:hypothetical protein
MAPSGTAFAGQNKPRTEVPSSKAPSRFRQIFLCDENSPGIASALGEIKGSKAVTVVGPNGKAAALVKEISPREIFSTGFFPVTRLELPSGRHCSTPSLAVLAPSQSIEVVPLKEADDKSAIERIAAHVDALNHKPASGTDVDSHPEAYLTNYRIADAKVFAVSSQYSVVLANVTFDQMAYHNGKYDKEAAGIEVEPRLFIVGTEITETSAKARTANWICDSLVSAFFLGKRLHIHVASDGRNNGIQGQNGIRPVRADAEAGVQRLGPFRLNPHGKMMLHVSSR